MHSIGGLGESLAQMDGGTINLSGMGHFGIISTIDNAANTATATALLTGGTITLGNDGLGFGAVNVTHSGLGESLIQMDGGTINTTGPNSLGLISEVQNVENTAVATVILTGGDIMTTGANSHGISVRHQGLGAVNISTVGTGTILTTGAEAHGIAIMHDNALATGTTTITLGGNIIAGGDGINVNSLSTGAVLITGNGNITGGADVGDDGIDVTTQGSVTIDVNGTISGDPGILVSSANGPIIIGGAGDVSGAGGNGIDTTITSAIATDDISIARDGIISGSVNGILATNDGMGNVNITANQAVSGGTAYGINTNTLAGSNTTIIPNSGAAVSSTAGLGIFNNGGDSTTTVNTGASVAGTISLGDGSDNLTFAGGDFSGVTLFDGGDDTDTADGFTDVLTFSGSSAALVGANIVNWENVVIDAGSIMSFSDNLLTAGTLTTNAGGILDASGSALAITGNLRNSGILTMQDGVAGDSVIVSGDYTGGGQLLVDVDTSTDSADTLVLQGANSSGTTSVSVNDIAAAGSATGNDIVVVDDTASGAAIFNLVSPPIVNGAFNYNALNNVGDDWVLQADFTAIASAYEHITAGMFTLNRLPTLQERIDNRNWQQTGASSGDTTNPKADAWLTVVGGKAKQDANNSTTSANYEVDYQQIKLGIDVKSKKTDEGYLMLGVNINSSAADTDVSTTAGNSNIDTDGYGIGLSATWYDNEGLYIDGQVQKNWYELDLAASGVGGGASAVDGDGYTASIEVGQRHSINDENTLFVTPQAQLIYSTIDFDSFVGPNAEQVALVENKSLRVRLGVTLDRNITKKDERSHTYFIANVIHEFNNDRSVNVSGFNLDSNADDWTGEIGVGGSYNWNNDEHSLYGEIKANTSLNKIGDNNGYEGRIGVRINF
ncbi:autotransporter outer membrane beta-barrel domain-containing protein [Candidatus Thioglobus sp.]|uniref:autotransporter family protein n=1 Tax=Candidatus Thioglobus sp. TaxID=2026721 RepID=UPI003D0D76F8